MSKAFSFEETQDKVGILYFDLKDEKVNKFSTEVMQELSEKLDELINKTDLKCLLFMSKKPGIFIAGADVNEIMTISDEKQGYDVGRLGQEVFSKMTKMPFPTVSVIDGACMGGGTEISLACAYRIATDSPKTKIAFPEVNIGILPGWGGTQRLPRLIGLQRAMDMILTGKNLNAKRALRSGVIDKIIAAEWVYDKAIEFAHEIITGEADKYTKLRKPKGLMSAVLEKNALGRKIMFSQAEKMIRQKTGGHYPAPLLALKTIEQTWNKSLEKGLEIEARNLGKLIATDICKNLVQIFLWTEEIKKENGVDDDKVKTLPVNRVAVLGAGVMGGGIAQLFASREISVRVKDINFEAVSKAYKQAADVLKSKLNRRRIKKPEYVQIMNRISGTIDYSGFKYNNLVIEAIIEDMELKKKVLAELENEISEETIIATNTSSLLVDEMAEVLKKKDRFVGMHFFNPVHRMPLVEVVKGKHSSDEAVATVFNLCKTLGKTPIAVNDGPGFLVNRLLVPYMVEAISLLQEGHSIKKLDAIMKKFGMPMGPIELFDEVGIDVAYKVAKILQKSMADRIAESDILPKLVEDKRLGKKTGKGFYLYEGRKKVYDPGVEKYITISGKSDLNDEQITQRMIYPMVNEAARCLDEGIVSNPRDVDIGMIFGTGFAPFRGGLLRFAEREKLEKVVLTLTGFEHKYGHRFRPSESLIKFKESGGFYKKQNS